MSPETEPIPTIEEEVLRKLGYEHCLEMPLKPDGSIRGRTFLDLYADPSKREETENVLYGFIDLQPDDPDHEIIRQSIIPFLERYFGPQQFE